MDEKITWITTRYASHLRNLGKQTKILNLDEKNLDYCIYFKGEKQEDYAIKFKKLLESFLNIKNEQDIESFCNELKSPEIIDVIKSKYPQK